MYTSFFRKGRGRSGCYEEAGLERNDLSKLFWRFWRITIRKNDPLQLVREHQYQRASELNQNSLVEHLFAI